MVSKGTRYLYQTTWGANVPPNFQGQDTQVQLGQRLRFARAGWIVGARYFRNTGDGFEHLAFLRVIPGFQIVRSATFLHKPATVPAGDDGWQHAYFRPRLRVEVGGEVVLCVYTTGGIFYFESAGCAQQRTFGDIVLPASGENGLSNGVYAYSSMQPPASTFNANRYGIDVLFLVGE